MTSELSNLAARLRERIVSEGGIPRGPKLETPGMALDSCHSSLRKDDAFNALALELFALQFEHNVAYRRIAESRGGTVRTVTHWSRIPAVPAAAFKELEVTCLPAAQRTHVFHSSGTTEQRPSRHFHNAESLAVYKASLWSWFKQHLISDRDSETSNLRLAILTPPPAQAPHSSLVHMFETVRRALGAPETSFFGRTDGSGSWELDFDSATRTLHSSVRDRLPLLLVGTAFSFVHLLDSLAGNHRCLQLPAGSRVMETGGYKNRSRSLPKAELHALITKRLGVPPAHIVCEYGMSELSSQAYDKLLEPADVASPHPGPPLESGGSGRESAPIRIGKKSEPTYVGCYGSGVQSAIGAGNSLSGERGNRRQPVGNADTLGNAGRRTSLPPLLEERVGVRAGQSSNLLFARRFQFPPWARAQIISPETGREAAEGETGLVRVFDLANVFSVMAIQTEDLGIRRGEGFELIGRAELAEPRGCSLLTI